VSAERSLYASVGAVLNGTYRLESVLAEGGMGIVFEAQHLRLPRRFAIKVLARPLGEPLEAGGWESALRRFRREAEIAAQLQHPHIIEVVDFQVSDSGAPYLVMELLRGQDLAARLKQGGRIAPVQAIRILGEIASALDCAHARGVVHRDLKPANIFLSRQPPRDDFVKVLDFGVSKLLDAATITHEQAMVGTPLYMSPEQALGSLELLPQSDLFSLGAIAFELLTGRRAFAASSIPSILYQIVHGPRPRVEGRGPLLTADVDRVFVQVFDRYPERRYATASDFVEALGEALGLERAPPPGLDAAELTPRASAAGGESPERWLEHGGESQDGSSSLPEAEQTARELVTAERTGGAVEAVIEASEPITGGAAPVEREPSAERAEAAAPVARRDKLPKTADRQRSRSAQGGRRAGVLFAVVALAGGAWQLLGRPTAGDAPPSTAARSGAAVVPTVVPVVGPTSAVSLLEAQPSAGKRSVRFAFSVSPPEASVLVDGFRVEGGELSLPRDGTTHAVEVTAPGYETVTLRAPAEADRTFELHLNRSTRQAPAVRLRPPGSAAPSPSRRHPSAPVQDL
jgi:serine/threonine-protein kinase